MAKDFANAVSHDLSVLFSSQDRDYLVRNNGDQVNISELSGKIVGLYFSASWCGPCRNFTPTLVEVYEELSSKGDLELVFVSSDRTDEAFNDYFSEMPWLAIPFSDVETRARLKELFRVRGIPTLAFLDGNGKVSCDNGVTIVREYGAEGYPFSEKKIKLFKDQEENAKQNQTLSSVLVSNSRDYVISNDGAKVPVADLEGKMVGLYIAAKSHPFCAEFTPKLVDAYSKLKEKGEKFEIVLISLDYEEEDFKESVKTMPWFAVPFKDKICHKLLRYFELRSLPTLVMIGEDGKTLNLNAAESFEEHGVEAYPCSPEKLIELDEIKRRRLEMQTLESLLVHGDRDYVIDKSGSKVPVSELVGKHVLLYFTAEWCTSGRAFFPKLIESYHEIKAKDDAFEVVFISSDNDQSSFDKFYAEMPWLALPYGDERKPILQRKFKIRCIPAAIVIDPDGKTVTKEARKHLSAFGAEAFPFTDEHVKKLEEKLEEEAKKWPEKVKHELHEHELSLTRRNCYGCDGCKEMGDSWSYLCKQCDFDLHPNCALKQQNNEAGEAKEGYVCDGDVCRRA